MFKGLLLASSLFIVSLSSNAQYVYVWRGPDGVMNYSDLPPVGGGIGHVRKLRINTFAPSGESTSTPALSRAGDQVHQSKSSSVNRGPERLSDNRGATPYGGGFVGGGGQIAGASSGGGASSASGSGSEGIARSLASGGNSSSGGTTTASSSPNVAVPISTAPAPDIAVPISTAPAPDLAVPISTAPAPDLAIPISTVPVTATSSATTTPSGVSIDPGGAGGGGTWSQIAGGSGGDQQATLYWDEVKKPPISKIPSAGYRVYVGLGPGQYLQPAGQGINAGNVTSYTVQGLKSGTWYYFSVTTYIGGSESKKSVEVSKLMP